MIYDLYNRTKKFSKKMFDIVLRVNRNDINRNVILQLIRSATSVGANYCEANNASSKKDFLNKIFICRKEIQESKYWIEMLVKVNPDIKDNLRLLWKEAHELSLIFNKISVSVKNSKNN